MTIHLGDVPANSTLYITFASYNSSGASVTLTGLAVTDIEIYKNGSVTQRSSDAGYALLDTDGIDFDGVTGRHGFSVDLSDNTDAGFYAVGSFYWIVVSAVTIDSQTVTLIPAIFRIVAAEAITGKPKVMLMRGSERQQNIALWEAGRGAFQGYLSCELPAATIKAARAVKISVSRQDNITRVICTYPEGITFTHRARGNCTVQGAGDCSANPAACRATCD